MSIARESLQGVHGKEDNMSPDSSKDRTWLRVHIILGGDRRKVEVAKECRQMEEAFQTEG